MITDFRNYRHCRETVLFRAVLDFWFAQDLFKYWKGYYTSGGIKLD